jgi:hypothetical protein
VAELLRSRRAVARAFDSVMFGESARSVARLFRCASTRGSSGGRALGGRHSYTQCGIDSQISKAFMVRDRCDQMLRVSPATLPSQTHCGFQTIGAGVAGLRG